MGGSRSEDYVQPQNTWKSLCEEFVAHRDCEDMSCFEDFWGLLLLNGSCVSDDEADYALRVK
jgi:hypothetical protein